MPDKRLAPRPTLLPPFRLQIGLKPLIGMKRNLKEKVTIGLHARSYEAPAALPIRLSYVSTSAPALNGV